MFTFKRNQVVICALVAMIGVAGYLNYIDQTEYDTQMVLSDNLELTPLNGGSSIANSNTYLDNPEISLSTSTLTLSENTTSPGDAIFVNSSSDTSYFVQAKLDREQVRAKEKDMLMEVVNAEATPEEQKQDAAKEVLELQQRIEKESAAEAMIESKGFNGVYVRIDDDTVDVVVNKSELTEQEIAQIQDIVSRKTGLSAEKIRINTLKTTKN